MSAPRYIGDSKACDGDDKCTATYKAHKWGSIKAHAEGWYQMRDGRAFCPKHLPDWVNKKA